MVNGKKDELKHALLIGALYAVHALAEESAGDYKYLLSVRGAIRNLQKAEELAENRTVTPSVA